jgi:hypothetical protein
MSELDWNAEAEVMARHAAEHCRDVARGVMTGRQSRVSVLFCNEASRDPAAVQDEVGRIRGVLDEEGIRVLGFAVAPEDGETWAMLVESEDVEMLNEIMIEQAD